MPDLTTYTQYRLVDADGYDVCRYHQDDTEDPIIGFSVAGVIEQGTEVHDFVWAGDFVREWAPGGEYAGFHLVKETVTQSELSAEELEVVEKISESKQDEYDDCEDDEDSDDS